jgi:hypothetical protein
VKIELQLDDLLLWVKEGVGGRWWKATDSFVLFSCLSIINREIEMNGGWWSKGEGGSVSRRKRVGENFLISLKS